MVREHQVRTVVAVSLYPALYAVLAARRLRDLPVHIAATVNTTQFATLKGRLQMLIYRHVLRKADTLIFGAELQRQHWCARYGLRRPKTEGSTFVLYNGVDTGEFSTERVSPIEIDSWPSSRLVLGTVGKLRVEKAHVHLVRAVKALRLRGFDVGAMIVGDGPQRTDIEREIQRLGLVDAIRMPGEVTDVRPYLAAMDIFVLPSVAVETFSNAALEAMAMRCPIVAADIGGMEEMLQYGGGQTYPSGNLKMLCDLLAQLLADAEMRRRLGEEARQAVVQHFGWNRMVNEFASRVLRDVNEVPARR